MAVRIINRSNELINSSVASLGRALCGASFLRDVSRENELNACLQETLEHELDFYHPVHGEDLESELKVWSDFFRFMPNDAGGIMSHINTLMEQEHGRLVHDWKHVDGYTHQMEQLIGNLQRFRILCKDFRIQDREYDCLTSNFLVEKPRGLRMDEHPFFMTARMMRKLRICRGNYSVIELREKYELLENFLLHDGGQFDDTFKLGSTVVRVKSLENPSMVFGTNVTIKTVTIEVDSGNLGSYETVVSVGSHIHVNLSTPVLTNIDDIKSVGRVLSCLKHMSNYKDDEAQFGVIDHLYKVRCDNFIVAKSGTIREILQMKPPNDVVLVDLSQVSDVPLIFGTDISTIHEIRRL